MTCTTRLMKYQHFRPPGAPFCSTYNEILAFSLSGGDPGSPPGPPKSTLGLLPGCSQGAPRRTLEIRPCPHLAYVYEKGAQSGSFSAIGRSTAALEAGGRAELKTKCGSFRAHVCIVRDMGFAGGPVGTRGGGIELQRSCQIELLSRTRMQSTGRAEFQESAWALPM